ncbi:MAG TPA: phosphatidate cytidylyltransferase [Candidatus Angelobacter sp.]|jgi:phosphatidate cytidylyltransferase
MKRVLTAVALIPVVLLLVFKAPLWLYALVVAAIILLTLHEYLGIAEAAGIKPFHGLTYAVGILPILLFFLHSIIEWQEAGQHLKWSYPVEFPLLRSLWILLVLAPVIFGIPLVFRKDLRGGLASSAASTFGVIYIAASLSLLIELRALSSENILIPFVLFSVWGGDIAAYYVGRTIGKHKLAPIVSPNKSWEGALASVVASVAIAFVVFHFTPQLSGYFADNSRHPTYGDLLLRYFSARSMPQPWHILAIGILTNVAAQFGDLFESALKRGAGVKDSGTLLPGHGGMLDRIDALLFAVPVVWYYANLTGFLQP